MNRLNTERKYKPKKKKIQMKFGCCIGCGTDASIGSVGISDT